MTTYLSCKETRATKQTPCLKKKLHNSSMLVFYIRLVTRLVRLVSRGGALLEVGQSFPSLRHCAWFNQILSFRQEENRKE